MIGLKSTGAISLLLLSHLCWADESTEIPGPAICASQEVLECRPIEGCTRVSVEDIHGPLFISLKPGESDILVTLADGSHETTTAGRRDKIDGKFIFQGADEADARTEDGIGWTLMITEDDGRMTLTASGEEVAFIIFGACTLL